MVYPVFIELKGRPAVIIGGGTVAYRKLKDLVEAGAIVKVVSPEISLEIEDMQKINPYSVEIQQRVYQHGDLCGALIAFAAANDTEVNKAVFEEAQEYHILVNSVDDPSNCSFYVPSMTRRGNLLLAVSTSGDSPAMAARLRRILEKNIPCDIEAALSALREAREYLKTVKNIDTDARGKILKQIVNDDGMLQELIRHNISGTLPSFFNCIL